MYSHRPWSFINFFSIVLSSPEPMTQCQWSVVHLFSIFFFKLARGSVYYVLLVWNFQIPTKFTQLILPGFVVQLVTCLTADTCLTKDPGRGQEFDPSPVPYFRGD